MARKKLETLSEQMFYVLMVLNKERCGVEIVDAVTTLTHGRIQLGPGTLYAILSQFEEEKFIKETKIEGRRRSYQITSEGEAILRNEQERLQTLLVDAHNYFGE